MELNKNMNTYFVYIHPSKSTKLPELNRYLKRIKVEPFGQKSFTVQTSRKTKSLLKKLSSFVGKKGFIFIIDRANPDGEPECYFPPKDQFGLLKRGSDLDKDAALWKEEFVIDD